MDVSEEHYIFFCLPHAHFLLGLLFTSEDGSTMFLRNIS
jgi:hypothetical protein